MVKQFFLPSLLGVILFLWLILAQATGYRSTSMSSSSTDPGHWVYNDLQFGYPTILEIRPGDRPAVQVYWKNLLLVLSATYVLTMPLGRWITGYRSGGEMVGPIRSGRRSPAGIVLYVIVICALLSVLATAILRRAVSSIDAPWIEMVWGLLLMGTVLTLPVTLIVMSVRRVRQRRSHTGRGFAVEIPHAAIPLPPEPPPG